jgi:hypothetical protein
MSPPTGVSARSFMVARAIPKSSSFTPPVRSNITLDGLTSRWTIPSGLPALLRV